MSNRPVPVNPLVKLQRQLIDESQHLLAESPEMQRLTNQFTIEILANQEKTQRYGGEIANATIHAYLDVMSAMLPNEYDSHPAHTLVNMQFDQALGLQADVLDMVTRQAETNIGPYEDLSTEYVESINDQFDWLLDTTHQFETQGNAL